jgi:DNA-nicking Smr family endonuclease
MRIGAWLRSLFAPRDARDTAVDEEVDVDPFDPFAGTDFPVRDVIDLHGLPPKMVREVVESYLDEAHRLGFRHVRIVHGKGIGVQREMVRRICERTPFVETFGDAPADAGGWGATVVRLATNTRHQYRPR